MSITLSGQHSKFTEALSARLDKAVLEKLTFEKAVISDDGREWSLFFDVTAPLTDSEDFFVKDAISALVPAGVTFKVTYKEQAGFVPPTREEMAARRERGESRVRECAGEPVPSEEDEREVPLPDGFAEPAALEGDDVPPPADAPIPDDEAAPPDDAYESIGADNTEDALTRYRKRLENLSREEAKRSAEQEAKKKEPKKVSPLSKDGVALVGRDFPVKDVIAIKDITEYTRRVTIVGDVIQKEIKELFGGEKALLLFSVTDYTSTIACKCHDTVERINELNELIDGHVAINGTSAPDRYSGELTVTPYNVIAVKAEKKTDDAPVKRVEMHLHTKMSQMDGVTDPAKLVKLMMQYGHDAVAITDHGVVQAFPDMEDAIAKYKANIKLILGVEGYLLDDDPLVSGLPEDAELSRQRVCFYSLRTTGDSSLTGRIFELGACLFENGQPVGQPFHTYINPGFRVDQARLEEAYTDQHVLDAAPSEEAALSDFSAYCEGCLLVSHAAASSLPFLREGFKRLGRVFDVPTIDTLRLSRELIQNIKSGKFNKVCEALEIRAGEMETALKEAQITAVVWDRLLEMLHARQVHTVGELNKAINADNGESYHIIIYAENKTGLFHLYQLITESHLHHLRRKRPQIPRSFLSSHREGLIISSACEAGELFRAMIHGASEERLEQIASFYDYLEVQPLGNNEFMVRDGLVSSKDDLIELNKRIIALGDKLGKPVLATGDVHYLLPRDAIFRSIIQCAEGYPDCDKQAPLYYRTTQEMLDEFYYLDEKKRYELVVTNPRKVADRCESMASFPRNHLYTPEMDHAEEDLREMCEKKAHEIYGDPLPEIVAKRLEKELTAIIKNGYAVLYLIAHKVVKKSLSDGYLVGSRGSVGSSFAATMADITEVNPLTPHYVCPKCKFSDFEIDLAKYDCGIDMPRRNCPNCGTEMDRLGFNIPFEVFMGFDGDKVPDIDLNFSGVYQPVVHKYIEELFGEKYVFRAGTIGGVADKTAIGYTRKYCETYGLGRLPMAEVLRLSEGCIDVKRTTGQHAGGVVILPKKYDVNEFTPLQYPANDPTQGIITTHFTFKSLHDTILKADILGHDDPTVIRMLENLTGINVRKEVPLDDPKVMDLFLSPASLGLTEDELGNKTGTFGIPEFGTSFTMKMLEETKPQTFSDLVKISGLSHGTDVWTGNAQDLVNSGTATISQCICTREDIMNNLLRYGCENFTSFDTMEKVRKGKGIPEKYLGEIREHGVPEWIIDSCNKIKYMFPKAHAAAYVTMALRIAWFKVYRPTEYYTTYFSVRADDFEIGIATMPLEQIRATVREYHAKSGLNPREKGILVMMEMIMEMKLRGIDFTGIDIYQSASTDFTVAGDKLIRPPLNAVPGLGENAAESIVQARQLEPFKSQDDLLQRTRLSATLLQALDDCGCLKGLPKSQQISLFDL